MSYLIQICGSIHCAITSYNLMEPLPMMHRQIPFVVYRLQENIFFRGMERTNTLLQMSLFRRDIVKPFHGMRPALLASLIARVSKRYGFLTAYQLNIATYVGS